MEQRTIDDGELRQWIDEWGEESHDDILPSDDEADIANRILEHHTRGEYAGDVDWNGAWESLRGIVGPALEHVHGFFPDGAETLARYVREIDMGIDSDTSEDLERAAIEEPAFRTSFRIRAMADADPESEIYDNAREISEAAEKARDVVKQISSMSRKNVETVYDAVPVESLVEHTCKLVETNCPKQVRLRQELELHGENVLGNSTQLQQVLLNICINGIHAIGVGEGSLTLRAKVVPREELAARIPEEKISDDWQSYVRVSVTDTGCGMDKDTLAHIFEPFFTTKKQGEGTGLGLALAEQIISTHRGHILAESTLGQGTTFDIYLPVLEQQRAREQVQWGVDHKLRILAADDNKKVLNLLEKDFGRFGLEVLTCSRRGEVRTLLETQPFDALAIDESLTGGSGVELCMSIQGKYPALTRIVMTSIPTREIVDARRHGVIDGYILKPVSAATLLEEIRACRRSEKQK